VVAGCGEVDLSGLSDAAIGGAAPDPTIAAVEPARGPLAGGTVVTVTGTGFAAAGTAVVVGGGASPTVDVASDTELSFVTPPGAAPATVDVTVYNARGFATAAAAFRYNPLPVATAIEPARGDAGGGAPITVTGAGFAELEPGATMVTVGGVEAASVDVRSDTELVFELPRRVDIPFQTLDVAVANDNGVATLSQSFTYTESGLLLATNRSSALRRLYFHDPVAGATLLLGELPVYVTGMAVAPDGTLYGVTNYDNLACCDRHLVTIDPLSRTVETVGVLVQAGGGVNYGLHDIAFVGDTLIGISNSLRQLVRIDVTNGEWGPLGSPWALDVSARPSGIAANGDAAVWMANYLNAPIRTIETATSAVASGATMAGTGHCRGLAWHDGTLYGINGAYTGGWLTSQLVAIDPDTGDVTVLGELPIGVDSIVSAPW
jgi:hypothetical protein